MAESQNKEKNSNENINNNPEENKMPRQIFILTDGETENKEKIIKIIE